VRECYLLLWEQLELVSGPSGSCELQLSLSLLLVLEAGLPTLCCSWRLSLVIRPRLPSEATASAVWSRPGFELVSRLHEELRV